MTDPVTLIRDLDADTIRDRLEAIEHERRALLVLLRAALRAKRCMPTMSMPPTKPTGGKVVRT
ncbi:hypothetical protein J8F10_21270 [Gemmata sp. G18]|uniref:IS66 family transposase n=1 Tax=Gemmata palustris TaxID=2822762 RepID=A0ABS5BVS4_9BACT|nr:hypothetical protein [Gemmata palustris]MBP3957791.1 hypothetical protein [Gemmata palustris]